MQIVVLGLTFILTCSAVYPCVGFGARAVTTAYVGNDPVVISHLAALPANDPMVTVIDNDVNDSGTVLAAAERAH